MFLLIQNIFKKIYEQFIILLDYYINDFNKKNFQYNNNYQLKNILNKLKKYDDVTFNMIKDCNKLNKFNKIYLAKKLLLLFQKYENDGIKLNDLDFGFHYEFIEYEDINYDDNMLINKKISNKITLLNNYY